MSDRLGPCRRCGCQVPRGATVCRGCGLDANAAANRRARAACAVAGVVLALAPLTLPAGVASLWKALVHHRALGGVVEPG